MWDSTVQPTFLVFSGNLANIIATLMFGDQESLFGWNDLPVLSLSGGRSSQAIVDGAMNALRALVKERLSGKSGGSGYNKQVRSSRAPVRSLHFIAAEIWKYISHNWKWLINAERSSTAEQRQRQQGGCGGAHRRQLWQDGAAGWRCVAGGVFRPLVWTLQEVSWNPSHCDALPSEVKDHISTCLAKQ